MHTKSLTTLEYPKIIERLAGETAFSASRALALALEPTGDVDEARKLQAYTAEARKLLDLRPDAGVRGARDVRPQAKAAERGKVLAPADLLEIAATIRSSIYVGRLITRLEEDGFPLLKGLAVDLPQRGQLEARIAQCISEEGTVLALHLELVDLRHDRVRYSTPPRRASSNCATRFARRSSACRSGWERWSTSFGARCRTRSSPCAPTATCCRCAPRPAARCAASSTTSPAAGRRSSSSRWWSSR